VEAARSASASVSQGAVTMSTTAAAHAAAAAAAGAAGMTTRNAALGTVGTNTTSLTVKTAGVLGLTVALVGGAWAITTLLAFATTSSPSSTPGTPASNVNDKDGPASPKTVNFDFVNLNQKHEAAFTSSPLLEPDAGLGWLPANDEPVINDADLSYGYHAPMDNNEERASQNDHPLDYGPPPSNPGPHIIPTTPTPRQPPRPG